MKKPYMLLLIALSLVSCASLDGKNSTVFYEDIPSGASVYLRSIELKPDYKLAGVSEEIAELIRSCLLNSGFLPVEVDSDAAYKLDIILNSRTWQYQYKSVESVTLSMRFYKIEKLAAFRLYTEDTEKSIDSFLWTFELIEKNIKQFASLAGNEK